MNNVTLSGNLTKDVEIRTGNFGEFVTFSVAVYNGKDKPAYFFDCVGNQYVTARLKDIGKKGLRVVVDGILTQKITKKDEITYNNISVSVKSIETFYEQKNSTESVVDNIPNFDFVDGPF